MALQSWERGLKNDIVAIMLGNRHFVNISQKTSLVQTHGLDKKWAIPLYMPQKWIGQNVSFKMRGDRRKSAKKCVNSVKKTTFKLNFPKNLRIWCDC